MDYSPNQSVLNWLIHESDAIDIVIFSNTNIAEHGIKETMGLVEKLTMPSFISRRNRQK